MTKQNNLGPQEKIERAIRRAWIAALTCGSITLVIGVIAIGGMVLVPGLDRGIVLDAVILLGLAFGVYKRNRICATLLVGYAVSNEVYVICSGIEKSPGLRLIFIYFYLRGMFAMFAYYKRPTLETILAAQDTTKNRSFKFTVQPSGDSFMRSDQRRRILENAEAKRFAAPDLGKVGDESTFAIHSEKLESEEPKIPGKTHVSKRNVLITSGVLASIAISIGIWHFITSSRQETGLQRTRSSVALIEVFDAANKEIATGSGFFISADGMLVTNFHVIRGANKAVAKVESGATYEVSGVLADDSKSDIALLRAKATGVPFLTLGDSTRAEIGQRVTVIGSPLGLEGTVSDGIISAKRVLPGNERWLQMTAPIAPGSSGSPVLNASNEVVGVATMLIRDGQGLNFAVPIEMAKALLTKINSQTEAKPLYEIQDSDVQDGVAKDTEKNQVAGATESILQGDAEYSELSAAIRSEDFTKALKLLKSLEARFPGHADEFYGLRAIVFYGLKFYADAILAGREAAKLKPNNPYVWSLLGECYMKQRDCENAIVAYQRALSIKPDEPGGWNSLGVAYKEQGQDEQALAAYQEALRLNPDASYAWYNVGRLYLAEKKFTDAIAALKKATEINQEYSEAWLFLGVSYEGLQALDSAIQSFHRYVGLKPEDSTGWWLLGLDQRNLMHFGPAAQAFETYTKLVPGNVDGWEELGRCYWRLRRADAPDTILHAISIKPQKTELWELLTVAYRDSGQTENAVKAFKRYQTLSSR